MITFRNNIPYPIKIAIGEDVIVIKEYEEYQFDNQLNSIEFIVENETVKKISFLGYLFLAIIGLIGFLFEMTDSQYLDFKKALSLPVKAKLNNIENDVLVIIEEPRRENIDFCIITANTKTEITTIVDEEEIYKQYKSFQKECLAVFSIPLLIVAIFLYFIIITKNIIAYIIGAVVVILVFSIWHRHHKKNKKAISNIISKRI